MKKPVLVVMFYEDGNSEYYMHISYLTSFLIRSPLLIEVPPTNIFPSMSRDFTAGARTSWS
jgi:hypothetical protein